MGISKKEIQKEADAYVKSKVPSKFLKKTPDIDKQLLSTNLKDPQHLEVIFKRYQEAGLFSGKNIPSKFKSAEHFRKVVDAVFQKQIQKQSVKIANIIDKNEKTRYINGIKRGILNGIIQGEAKRQLTAQGVDWANDPMLKDKIDNLKYKGLPLKAGSKGISYNSRQFSDKVLDTIVDWANNHEIPNPNDPTGKTKIKPFTEEAGKKWAKNARAEWRKWGEINRALKAKYGIDFDIGHFVPSALGGPNVGANAATELTWNRINEEGVEILGNRPKGKKPGLKISQIANELHVPESYLQDFLNKQLGVSGKGVSLIEEAVVPSAGDMQRVANAGDLDEQIKAADKLAATTRSDVDEAAQLLAEVENYKKQGIISPETTVIGDGTKNPQIKSFDDLKQYSSAKRAIGSDFEVVNNKVVKAGKRTTKDLILKVLKNVNHTSNLIPTPVKTVVKGAAATGFVGLGLIDDVSASVKPFITDYDGDAEQRKIDEMKSAAGMAGLYATATGNIPAASLSMLGWSAATYKDWAKGNDKSRIADLELSVGLRSNDRDRSEPDVLTGAPTYDSRGRRTN